jgi:redox-sensitive bicupin YhaK (pirin superfamily)
MSAGSGVTHSEFNPSSSEPVHFLQIWIHPAERGLAPGYTEWHPDAARQEPLTLVISADGRDGSARIAQDADVVLVRMRAGDACDYKLREGRAMWLQVMRGSLVLESERLEAGDAASTEAAGDYRFQAEAEEVEALLFDLAAHPL